MSGIALIDYGAGNLHSVYNALRKAGAGDVVITADADVVARADRIVLPGVGAFRACRDVLVCSVGTGGHSAGIARVLRRFHPHMRLIGVDTIASTIFGQPAGNRLMRGLGSSIYPHNVDYAAFDEVHWVAPAEAVWAARALASTHHATGGWSVGAVALVAGWAAGSYTSDTRIAAVFPDGPHRYYDTIFSDEYCRDHGLLDGDPPIEPATIAHPAEHVVQAWTRCATVVDQHRLHPADPARFSGSAR